jgi:hypothetical protein
MFDIKWSIFLTLFVLFCILAEDHGLVWSQQQQQQQQENDLRVVSYEGKSVLAPLLHLRFRKPHETGICCAYEVEETSYSKYFSISYAWVCMALSAHQVMLLF